MEDPTQIREDRLCERCASDTEFSAEAARRRELYREVRSSSERRSEEYQRCASDVVYWLKNYGWTYNPKRIKPGQAKTIPFVPFEKQEEFLGFIQRLEESGEVGITEKSRNVGMTWVVMAFMVHRWLFHEEWAGGVGSRKEDLVDKRNDPDSLLEKARILVRSLPTWMIPRGYVERINAPSMRIENPQNGSIITGEAGKDIGRGGRKSFYFVDEAAFLADGNAAEAALSENSDTQIWGSTPNGVGNAFYTKRFAPEANVFTIHWKDDPFKNHYYVVVDGNIVGKGQGRPQGAPEGATVVYPWYEGRRKARGYNKSIIAQEYDISYTASLENMLIEHEWVIAAQNIQLEAKGYRTAGVDVGGGGEKANTYIERTGPVVTMIEASSESNTNRRARFLMELGKRRKVRRMVIDVVGVGLGVVSDLEVFAESKALGFDVVAFRGGDGASTAIWEQSGETVGDDDIDERTGKEMFLNARAEAFWGLRRRFEKTWEVVNGVAEYPPEELICIPDDPELAADLCKPLYKFQGDGGKIKIESKAEMAKRQVASPHKADGLMMAFYEPPAKGWALDPKLYAKESA